MEGTCSQCYLAVLLCCLLPVLTLASSGAVRASVTVQEKHASGSGKLTGVLGRGTWTSYSGDHAAWDPGQPSGSGSDPKSRG